MVINNKSEDRVILSESMRDIINTITPSNNASKMETDQLLKKTK